MVSIPKAIKSEYKDEGVPNGEDSFVVVGAGGMHGRTGGAAAAPPNGVLSSTPGNVPARKTNARNFFNDSGRQEEDSTVNMMTDEQELTAKRQM